MSLRRNRSVMVVVLLPLLIAGCGKPRIDDTATIDVCQLMSDAEIEGIVGPTEGTPVASSPMPGFAGGCSWSFKTDAGDARLSAAVMTRASAAMLSTTPTRWFESSTHRGEMTANLGAPAAIKGIGDMAYLYAATLEVRRGETVLMLGVERGDAAQLEACARTLLAPKKR